VDYEQQARTVLLSLNSKPMGGSRAWDEAVSAIAAALRQAAARPAPAVDTSADITG